MSVQPIDLQTMYSQMNNVSKQVAFQQQGVVLGESMQQQNIIQQNAEQSKKVQETTQDSKLGNINQNGKQNFSGQNSQDNSKKQEQNDEIIQKNRLKEDYLGNHIDITR